MTAVSDETGGVKPSAITPVEAFLIAVRARWNFEEAEFDAIERVIRDPQCIAALSAAPVGDDGRLPERETFWLVERIGHGQWIKGRSFDTLYDLTSDVWHAERYRTEREANERWRQLSADDRRHYSPTEHIFIHKEVKS